MAIIAMLKSAKQPPKVMRALEKAGHVVMLVNSYDDVRFMTPTPANLVHEAALEVALETGYISKNRDEFHRRLGAKVRRAAGVPLPKKVTT